MFDFHEKRKIRSILYSPVTIVVILVLAGLLSMSVYERYTVEREVAVKRMEKEAELSRLKERAASLEEDIGHLQSERGIEEELRTRFDVAKEGEQVIVIVGAEEKKNVPPPREEVGVWHKIVDFLSFWK